MWRMEHDDSVLGRLTYAETLQAWEGTVSLEHGDAVSVMVHAVELSDRMLSLARAKIDQVRCNLHVLKNQAAADLRRVKNETWLQPGEMELDLQEFLSRLTVESISVYDTGAVEVDFDDGDMFWGNSVVVKLDPAFALIRAEIQG